MSNSKKVILITGGSSGIGFEAAKILASQGHTVYAASRRTDRMEPLKEFGIRTIALDVTVEESMTKCVNTVLDEQGRIDVLVNNAGYGYLGAIENVPVKEAKRQLEVNLFGMARLIQLVMPSMRENGGGRIINISSVAGKVVVAYGGWYNVSKFAVEALSDALRIEAKPFGVDVVLIEPSAIKTDWGLIAADNLEAASKGTAYEKFNEKEIKLIRKGYLSNLFSGPQVVAKAISRAANVRRPRLRYRPGRGACFLITLHALMPARWWDAANRRFAGMPR